MSSTHQHQQPRPSTGRAFWRVSFAGHAHPQQSHRFVCQPPLNIPVPPAAAANRLAADRAEAQSRAAATSPPALRVRGALPAGLTDVGDSGTSSFDVVESMPRSKLPSVRSMGSLVMVGSPDTVRSFSRHGQHGTHQHQHQVSTPQAAGGSGGRVGGGFPSNVHSFGSLAATPTSARGRSVNLGDLEGMRPARSPGSTGTAVSFPSVSTATPQQSPLVTRAGSPSRRGAGPPPVSGMARALTDASDDECDNVDADDGDGAATAGPLSKPQAQRPSAMATTSPAPTASPARSLAHFRVVDARGCSAGVGLRSHARWANSAPATIATDPFGAVLLDALLSTLRGRTVAGCRSQATSEGSSSSELRPPTPPNSEVCSGDDEYEDGNDDESEKARRRESRRAGIDIDDRSSPSERLAAVASAARYANAITGDEFALTEELVRQVAAQEGGDAAVDTTRAIYTTQAWLRRSRRFGQTSAIGFTRDRFNDDDADAAEARQAAALEAIFGQALRSGRHSADFTTRPTLPSFGPGGPEPQF